MNRQLLRKFEPERIVIHPQNEDRSVFYAIVLAFIIKNKHKNVNIDFIFDKRYRFLRKLIPFKVGKLDSSVYYDFYISLQKDYKVVWKYRILKARVRFGLVMPFANKIFDVLLKNEDNPRLIIEDFGKILNLDFNVNIWFNQLELKPYIKRKETLFISPYNKKITNFLAHKISKKNYKLIYSNNYSLESLLTTIIHNYERVILLNSSFDHFISFMSKVNTELLFSSINYKEHYYSRTTRINPIKYVCSPCNVNSVYCPLKDKDKQYLCLKKGIYSI